MRTPDHAVDTKKNREAAIFEAACKVIRDKGLHQARMVDIARGAGISYGLVYHYFGSKADLFDAISNKWWNSLYAMMEESESRTSAVEEQLTAIVHYFLDLYEDRPNLVHVFVSEISRSRANLTPAQLDFFRLFFDKTEKIMARGQSTGTLRKDIRARYLTYIFVGALEGFVSTMVFEDQPIKGVEQKQRIATGLLEVFFNGARCA